MNNTKHITFNPDGSQKEPNWDKIDHDTKELEERDAVDTENHDCHKGFEDACDCDKI